MRDFLAKVRFTHILSFMVLVISSAGGFIVLLVPDFPGEIKGSVVTLMLVGGFTAVLNFWLGSSASSERKDKAITERKDITP